MKKLAFCFLVYDRINHEELWQLFFKDADPQKYSIYIHYKDNVPLKYFEQYKLQYCVSTQHGNISLVKAQNLLFKEALKDPNTSHCIILSNSCIPFKSFDTVYKYLDPIYSYFNQGLNNHLFPRCNDVINHIGKKYIDKSAQWCILNKKHATIVVNDTDYIEWFTHTYAPDEHAYITKLNTLNLQDELILTKNQSNNATTFINWDDMDYKFKSTNGLKNYTFISEEELDYLLASPCLFGRKFLPECNLSYKPYINAIQRKSIT